MSAGSSGGSHPAAKQSGRFNRRPHSGVTRLKSAIGGFQGLENPPLMAMSPLALRGPRSLLRQIREAMASGGPAQARLDMVVRIIAGSMVAEVCSIYLRRGEGNLELF